MAVDIFLCLSNDIMGETQDAQFQSYDGYAQAIDIQAWNWGMTQSGTTHEGGGGGGGKVNVQDIVLTKYVDLSSHDLIQRCASGDHIDDGVLVVRKAAGTGQPPLEYFKIEMENVIVSSYTTGGGVGELDRVQETFSLNFRKFEVIYTLQNADGTAGPESKAGWDVAASEEWGA